MNSDQQCHSSTCQQKGSLRQGMDTKSQLGKHKFFIKSHLIINFLMRFPASALINIK